MTTELRGRHTLRLLSEVGRGPAQQADRTLSPVEHLLRALASCLNSGLVNIVTGGQARAADRVVVALSRLSSVDDDVGLQGRLAAECLVAAGAVDTSIGGASPARPGRTDLAGQDRSGQVSIQAFGTFAVFVDGRPTPVSAWQSRKARDLLRILVARRGRAVPRLELCELLWPDDDPFRTAHRLSVLLSIVRTVCGQHVLIADPACVRLDLTRVRVDVEDFLNEIGLGIGLSERGELERSHSLLAAAERRYAGQPFEDDPYQEWAVPFVEEARAAYVKAVRHLAGLAHAAGDREGAASYLRRLLSVDPYDEPAHQSLVTVLVDWGRHGEARRAFGRYVAAMAAMDVPGPDKAILHARTLVRT